jgi:hypothetical protein
VVQAQRSHHHHHHHILIDFVNPVLILLLLLFWNYVGGWSVKQQQHYVQEFLIVPTRVYVVGGFS